MKVISEGPVRVTRGTIDAVWRRRSAGSRLILRDQDCRGLALVVNPTGMTWSYSYRPRGTDPVTGQRPSNRAITIGNPATHSPDEARIAANKIKGAAAGGADPASERMARAQVAQRQRALTMERLIEDYTTSLPRRAKLRGTGLPSPAHVAEELSQVRAAMIAMDAGKTPIGQLAAVDVRRAIGDLANKPATARARFGALSRFFDWCQDEGHISANPCLLVARARRPKTPAARTHYLSVADVAKLWKATDKLVPDVYRCKTACKTFQIPGVNSVQ